MGIDWLLVFIGAAMVALVALWVYRPKRRDYPIVRDEVYVRREVSKGTTSMPSSSTLRRERSDLSPPIQRPRRKEEDTSVPDPVVGGIHPAFSAPDPEPSYSGSGLSSSSDFSGGGGSFGGGGSSGSWGDGGSSSSSDGGCSGGGD